MDEWCVFCGAPSPGGIVCPSCRWRLNDLPEDKRRVIEEIEENEKARETMRAAITHMGETLATLLESITTLLRQFGRK